MASTKICTFSSLSPGTVLDTVIRCEIWAYRLANPRRIGYFPGAEDGIVQDYGKSITDAVITGQAFVTRAQATKLESMYAASTTYWGFCDGLTLYKVYFNNLEEAEPFGGKSLYEIELGVSQELFSTS
jgi:hypothetical protein